MPYSVPFLKITAGGHFGSSGTVKVEQWSTSLHLSSNGGTTADASTLTAFLTLVAPSFSDYHSASAPAAGTKCFLTTLTGASIGTDGKYIAGSLQPTTVFTYASPITGGIPSNAPWSQACVITLRSLRLRGPASHGRMYWPATGLVIDPNTGVLTTTVQGNIATAANTMLNGINTAATTIFGTGVRMYLCSNLGSGFQSPVVQLGIGGRMDHMESRERNMSEAHVYRTVAGSTAFLEEREEEWRDARDELLRPGGTAQPR
jgi:hypothetical protein